jgi:hypothetical protein
MSGRGPAGGGGDSAGRRRLGLPLLAQGASFVLVLVIGALFAHGSTPRAQATSDARLRLTIAAVPVSSPLPVPTPSRSAHPGQKTSPPTHRRSGSSRGAPAEPAARAGSSPASPFEASPVRVLGAGTLRTFGTWRLSSTGKATLRVGHGSYEVCLRPPPGWRPASASAFVLSAWVCQQVAVGSQGVAVTFALSRIQGGQE